MRYPCQDAQVPWGRCTHRQPHSSRKLRMQSRPRLILGGWALNKWGKEHGAVKYEAACGHGCYSHCSMHFTRTQQEETLHVLHPEMVGGRKKSSGLSDSLSRLRCHLPQESLPPGSSLQTWPCGLAPFLSFGLQSAPLTLSPTPYEVPIAERLAV